MKAMAAMSLLILASCANIGRDDAGRDDAGRDNAVPVANGLVFNLLPPASFGQHLILTQVVTIGYQRQEQQLLFYSEVSASAIDIAGLLPDGTRLFSIRYDGVSLQSEGSTDILQRLDPRYLLADMQIALWPLTEVRSSFAASNVCFATGSCELVETGDQLTRTLSKDGNVVVAVHYSGVPHHGAMTNYQHRGRSYGLRIETVDVELLEQTGP